MAKDPHDRARWLHGLNHFRREIEDQRKNGEVVSTPKAYSNLANTTSTLLD